MSQNKNNHGRLARFARRSGCAAVLLSALAPACLNRPIDTIEPRNTFSFNYEVPQSRVDKIDILLAIDDSGSMGDKQDILAVAVPDLVDSLVNPACVNPTDGTRVEVAGPLSECPDGTRREFEPVLDIHLGVISTSLGPRGSDVPCTDDGAMLLDRQSEGEALPTFQDKGFLAWDPEAEAPGAGSYQDATALNGDLAKLVQGVGDGGCGLEAQLESWYRFLVDPKPYAEVVPVNDIKVDVAGVDDALLAQRAAFLRPDSLVAIVMLTDENDCSFQPNPQGFLTGGKIMGLKARKVCDDNPADPCCTPCGYEPETCPADPTCAEPQPLDRLQGNLTCMQQKRRYGAELLHSTQRYIDGLTKRTVKDRDGNEVDNPLYVAPDGELRGDDRVFFAGIVGVPWQLIARDQGDLTQGFKNAEELTESNTWDTILGDPASHVPPSDPHMVETLYARPGLSDMNSGPNADPISGHEFEVLLSAKRGDPQYACIFDLPQPLLAGQPGNECVNSYRLNDPLCQAPDGSYGETQYRAKAFPGTRHLEVLKGIGDKGIVGSICPAQLQDSGQADYGYRPAIEALIERLKQALVPPCLPRPLVPNEVEQVSCLLLEGRALEAGESCTCDHALGRAPVTAAHQKAADDVLASPAGVAQGLDCVCEIEQLTGEPLNACQHDLADTPEVSGEAVHGWCYVDEQVAAPELVAHCSSDRQTIRFVGEGHPVNNSLLVLSCHESDNE